MTEQSRLSFIQDRLGEVSSIVTIGQNDPRSSRLGVRSKMQIEQWLEAQARLLIDKKQRQREKQNKLKQLEEQFEQKRELKHRSIDQKLTSSSRNKSKNLKNIQKKLTDVSKRHNSVVTKVQYEQQREVDKLFNERKVYEQENKRPTSKRSNFSRSSISPRYNFTTKREPTDYEIQKQMMDISTKLDKAQTTKNHHHIPMVNKIHNHNTHEIKRHQMRASQQLSDQLNHYSKKIVEKTENAESNKKKSDRSLEKILQNRERFYSEKLRAYQDNLRSLDSQKSEKLQELGKKIEQINPINKSWHNDRDQAYHTRFLANISLLQQKKMIRADKILQKHQEITVKNRVYRERKDNLLKAIKHDPSDF